MCVCTVINSENRIKRMIIVLHDFQVCDRWHKIINNSINSQSRIRTPKLSTKNVDLCIKLSDKASRRRWRWCWYLKHDDIYTRILSWHFPMENLQNIWALFISCLIWNTERSRFGLYTWSFPQFHIALCLQEWCFVCCELVLAVVCFDEIEFILHCAAVIFGYMCIPFVLLQNFMFQIWLAPLVLIVSIPFHRHPNLVSMS